MFLKELTKDQIEIILGEQGKKVINYFIQKSMFAQPEKISKDQNVALRIPKEHIEEWFIQALKVKHTGSGSYPVDFINTNEENNYGADIKCLTYKIDKNGNLENGDSGETSLGQNFKDGGQNLDSLFKEKKHDEILIKWKELLTDKLEKPVKDHNIEKIYYFFILLPNDKSKSCNQKIYLCGTEVLISEIDNFEIDKTTDDSVYLKNVISDDLGNAKIYKAKKRLELRIKPKKWVEKDLVVEFDISLNNTPIAIRDFIDNEEIMDLYSDYCYQKIVKQDNNKTQEILKSIEKISPDLYSKLVV